MKRILYLMIALCLAFGTSGQKYVEANRVQVINHKIVIPPDGNLEEALALTQEWTENVLRKNQNFEEIHLLISDTEKDTIDLMVIYKYKQDLTEDTNEIIQELIAANWPQEGSFAEFMKRLHRYIDPKMNIRSVFNELVLKQ